MRDMHFQANNTNQDTRSPGDVFESGGEFYMTDTTGTPRQLASAAAAYEVSVQSVTLVAGTNTANYDGKANTVAWCRRVAASGLNTADHYVITGTGPTQLTIQARDTANAPAAACTDTVLLYIAQPVA